VTNRGEESGKRIREGTGVAMRIGAARRREGLEQEGVEIIVYWSKKVGERAENTKGEGVPGVEVGQVEDEDR